MPAINLVAGNYNMLLHIHVIAFLCEFKKALALSEDIIYGADVIDRSSHIYHISKHRHYIMQIM